MNTILRGMLAAAIGVIAATPALAHIGYGGRDFGSFDGLSAASVTISNQTIRGNYGWADATDADWGDSHAVKAYRFHLDNTAIVKVDVMANAGASSTSVGGLLPAFSIYQGLAHLGAAQGSGGADYDTSLASLAYKATLPGGGAGIEGLFIAVGDWKIGNNDLTIPLSEFKFKGYAADGTQLNLGNVNPLVGGDGVKDGKVSGSFLLGAGDYSLFIGGADYASQFTTAAGNYGISATLSVAAVPEPQTALLMLTGMAALAGLQRRRARRG
jgi:hypothetical protein